MKESVIKGNEEEEEAAADVQRESLRRGEIQKEARTEESKIELKERKNGRK